MEVRGGFAAISSMSSMTSKVGLVLTSFSRDIETLKAHLGGHGVRGGLAGISSMPSMSSKVRLLVGISSMPSMSSKVPTI